MLRVERAAGPSCWGCCFMVMKERANCARPARMGIRIRPMQAHSRWKFQAQEVVVHVDPPVDAAAVVGHLGGDLLDQVDLAVGLQLGQTILEHHGAVLGNLDDVAHGHTGIGQVVDDAVHYLLGEHHEVGDGLTDDGVQRDQNGQGQKAPQTAAHGVDPLLGIELLHLLAHFRLVVGVLLLNLLHPAGHPAHAHHALLGFHLQRQQNQLEHQGEEDDGHAVRAGELIEHADQPGKGDTDDVSDARKHKAYPPNRDTNRNERDRLRSSGAISQGQGTGSYPPL